MSEFVTNVPFPPAGTQVCIGSGTLTKASVKTMACFVPMGIRGMEANMYHIDATVYDSAKGSFDKSTPLLTINRLSGVDDPDLSIPFERGLYVDQRSPSGITVVWEPAQ